MFPIAGSTPSLLHATGITNSKAGDVDSKTTIVICGFSTELTAHTRGVCFLRRLFKDHSWSSIVSAGSRVQLVTKFAGYITAFGFFLMSATVCLLVPAGCWNTMQYCEEPSATAKHVYALQRAYVNRNIARVIHSVEPRS